MIKLKMQSFVTAVCCRTLYERDTMTRNDGTKMSHDIQGHVSQVHNSSVLRIYCVRLLYNSTVVYLVQ